MPALTGKSAAAFFFLSLTLAVGSLNYLNRLSCLAAMDSDWFNRATSIAHIK